MAPIADAMVPRLLAEVTLTQHPERVEAVRRMIFSNDPRGIAAASRGMANRGDATPLLPEIACPALLIAGQHDQIVPVAEMRAMAEAMPHARLVEIRGAGHLSPLENPAEVNAAILSFLGELRST